MGSVGVGQSLTRNYPLRPSSERFPDLPFPGAGRSIVAGTRRVPSLKQELSAPGNGSTGFLQGQYTAFRPDRELENLPARKGCCRTGGPSLLVQQLFHLAAPRDMPRIGPESPPRRVERSTPGRTRTCNIRLRRPMLYPIELQGRLVRSGTVSAAKMARSPFA